MNGFIALLKTFGKKQSFQPNVLSIFLNPSLFIRWYLYKEIKHLAPKLEGRLLDFGCGRKPYRSLFQNVNSYIGIDIEVSGHPHTESEVDVYYDGKTIPFPDNYFDAVFCTEVIEHVFNIEEVLIEIKRVLKNNGTAIFTFPFSYQEHEQPFDFARYTSYGTKYIFEKYGFKILSQKKTGHFIIVLWQLFINYIYNAFNSKNIYIKTTLTIIFISPLNLIGLLFFAFPKSKDLYFNNVVFIKKTNE